MDRGQLIEVLNYVLRTLHRSLPMYVQQGRRLWTTAEAQPLRQALAEIAADEQYYVARIGSEICRLDGRVETGQFPLDFTSMNDVSVAWLWQRVIELHKSDIATIERCREKLGDVPAIQSLIEEVLGNVRGHLQTLEEIAPSAQNVAR